MYSIFSFKPHLPFTLTPFYQPNPKWSHEKHRLSSFLSKLMLKRRELNLDKKSLFKISCCKKTELPPWTQDPFYRASFCPSAFLFLLGLAILYICKGYINGCAIILAWSVLQIKKNIRQRKEFFLLVLSFRWSGSVFLYAQIIHTSLYNTYKQMYCIKEDKKHSCRHQFLKLT